MGYHAHHGIIVTGYAQERVEKAHAEAGLIFDPRQVTSIAFADTNGYWSFLVGPDGSKEGWGESDKGDERRATFLAFLRGMWNADEFLNWVEVRYGGDEPRYAQVTDKGEPDAQDEHGDSRFSLAPTLGTPLHAETPPS